MKANLTKRLPKEVLKKTINLFAGNKASVLRWLVSASKALQNEPPLAHCRNESGTREVEDLIGRLEHGVFP